MSSIYPSLEDMTFHQLTIAQNEYFSKQTTSSSFSSPPPPVYQTSSHTSPNAYNNPPSPYHSANPPPYYQHPSVPSHPSVPTFPSAPIYPSAPPQESHSPYYYSDIRANVPTGGSPVPSYPQGSYPSNPYQAQNSYPSVPNQPQAPNTYPSMPNQLQAPNGFYPLTSSQQASQASLPYPINPLASNKPSAPQPPAYSVQPSHNTAYPTAPLVPSTIATAPSAPPANIEDATRSTHPTTATAPSVPPAIHDATRSTPSPIIAPSVPPTNRDTIRSALVPLYPSLDNYMGLEVASELINAYARENAANERESDAAGNTVARQAPRDSCTMIAPLSSSGSGLKKAYVTNGIRELVLCKDASGLIGLRVCAINEGVFVCLVERGSPASLVGLRFGDQILSINGETVAGYNMKQVHKILKAAPVNNIRVVIRDRPLERTVTLHRDSSGHFGFHFNKGQIVSLVKDSSAARNGLLVNHNILEVNGANVVGLKDKELLEAMEKGGSVLTLTLIPTSMYQHMMKKMSFNLVKDKMDHSI
ncbi:syntenin-2 [Diaphorina citri]|uniref:Syntenin-2 n=1 Tax=Diaphorina citri TaxID=121845 RepID=A0A1S3CUJ2_DIACI|nr:syntenin-2 [Diaphorina citri]XP_008468106.1 syntenin-2 [Diaphorina citri]KAI5720010.1 hypothetical protein M8J77_000614 [Diaphorina citri]